jgi:hypothetical protein
LWGLWGLFSFFLPRLSKNPQAADKQEGGEFFNNHVIAPRSAAERKILPAADDLIGARSSSQISARQFDEA